MTNIYYTDSVLPLMDFLKSTEQLKNIPFDEKDILVNKYGKPYFSSLPYHFNYSHTHSASALIISKAECAIDIEDEYRILPERIAKRYFSEIDGDFMKAWTYKEAFVKFLGKSIFSELEFVKTDFTNIYYKDALQDIKIFSQKIDGFIVTAISKGETFNIKKI